MRFMCALFAVLAGGSTPTIIVRAVDSSWKALPGISVTATPTARCDREGEAGGRVSVTTVADGSASLPLSGGPGVYLLAAGGNGWEIRSECIQVPSDTSLYVEFRLRLEPENVVTIQEPTTTSLSRSIGMGLSDFVGVYEDTKRGKYVVGVDDSGNGLDIQGPDLRTMSFSQRSGNTFTGPDGSVTFHTRGRRVIDLRLSIKPTLAKRLRSPGR